MGNGEDTMIMLNINIKKANKLKDFLFSVLSLWDSSLGRDFYHHGHGLNPNPYMSRTLSTHLSPPCSVLVLELYCSKP